MQKITLKIYWSKKENDFVVCYPSKGSGGLAIDHVVGKRVSSSLTGMRDLSPTEKFLWREGRYDFFETDFIAEMKARGFDVKTLKFSIKLDPIKIKESFPHIYEQLTDSEKEKLGL